MSNFEAAVKLMNERWFDSLTELEDYVPSKKHQRAMNRLFDKMRGDKYHRLTRRAVALLVAAAIMLCAATAAIANETSRNYIIEKYKEYSVFRVENPTDKEITTIEIGYIPEGFEIESKTKNKKACSCVYQNNDDYFIIEKWHSKSEFKIDTEEHNYIIIEKDGIEYCVFKSNNSFIGIIWNSNNYNYKIESNLSEEELLKIAYSTN